MALHILIAVVEYLLNTSHLCLGTIYSSECPLLGSGGALIKNCDQKGGALSRGGAHSNKYGIPE